MRTSNKRQPETTEWLQQSRQALDQIPLDASTRSALDAQRRQALRAQPAERFLRPAVLAGAFASLGALALAINLWRSPDQTAIQIDSIDAFEIISARDDLELYQNLEFYLWLEQQPDNGLG